MNIEDIVMKHGHMFHEGKYYAIDMERGKPKIKDITDKVEKQLALADEISEKLYKKVDSKKIMTEALMKLEPEEIQTLYIMLFKDKKQYKVKTREHHCCDVKVGNFILPIID
jgi:hypothetical protein